MKFEDLMGARVGFCGVDNNTFCIVTMAGERLAFECVEDENDGYRSSLQELKPVPLDGLIFFATPVAVLTIRETQTGSGWDSFDGYTLVDDAEHVWLKAGTNNHDDYYPSFCFQYDPPKEATEKGSVDT